MSYCIVTLCSSNMLDETSFLRKSWAENSNAQIYIYTDQKKVEQNITYVPFYADNPSSDWITNIMRRTMSMRHALFVAPYDNVVFLDADVYLSQDIEHVFCQDFDIAYCKYQYRPRINLGVLFLKKTRNALRFIDKWIERQVRYEERKIGMIPGRSSLNEMSCMDIINSNEKYKILELDLKKYNLLTHYAGMPDLYSMFFDYLPQACAIHFTGGSYQNPRLIRKVFEVLKKPVPDVNFFPHLFKTHEVVIKDGYAGVTIKEGDRLRLLFKHSWCAIYRLSINTQFRIHNPVAWKIKPGSVIWFPITKETLIESINETNWRSRLDY